MVNNAEDVDEGDDGGCRAKELLFWYKHVFFCDEKNNFFMHACPYSVVNIFIRQEEIKERDRKKEEQTIF